MNFWTINSLYTLCWAQPRLQEQLNAKKARPMSILSCEAMVSWTYLRLSEDLPGKVQQPVGWSKREVWNLETSNTELIAEATWEVKPQ